MSTINLTTGTDNLTGTSEDDTFLATYNDGPTDYTFGVSDVLDGGAGTDTLDIDTNHVGAITPLDAYWSDLSNIEKVVIHGGVGAQTITTGSAFNASFAAGVDLATSSNAGAITLTMGSFTGDAVIAMTSTDGVQTFTSGSGHTTVIANSTAGAQTITGPGLEVVTATSTHGVQTITGANLTSVTATSMDGAQTITGSHMFEVNAHTTGAQTITMGSGANRIVASSTAEDNAIVSKAGDDVISVEAATGRYHINAGSGHDSVKGGEGDDHLVGGTGKDVIHGGAGNDMLMGGAGRDNLTGGTGNDSFVLNSKNGFDTITDFSVTDDTISIDSSIFTSLTAIAADNLVIGAHAVDANDFLVYNSNTGKLFYDADANGAGHAVVIAVLGVDLGLTSADFSVI